MREILLILLFSGICLQNSQAQEKKEFQVWSDFSLSYNLGEKWKVGGDLGYRIIPSSKSQTTYIRPGIVFHPNRIVKFTAGFANFNYLRSAATNSTEIRAFQFVTLSWPQMNGFKFKHRLGLEQRNFFITDIDIYKFVHRFRYYLNFKSPKFNLFAIKSPFFVSGNFELLTNINDSDLGRLFDHHRVTVGVGNLINDKFRIELKYKILSVANPVSKTFINEIDVIRLRLYYQIK